ncbi:MAG: AMP-binding protein [Thermoleophilia bacterium]|nr:AMP-binding protein [Thermoleophilia bacterium]
MFRLLEGAIPFREEDAARYVQRGWWRGLALGDLLDEAADIHPDKEAFIDQTDRVTYGQARERAHRLAIAFMKLGVEPLDRVLVQLPNWTEFAPAYFALQKIGAIPVMLIDRYRQLEIEQLGEITGAKAWIVPVRHGKTDYLPIIRDVRRARPAIERVVTVRGEVDEPGFWSLEGLIAETEPDEIDRIRLAERRPDPMQVAHMGPTGGTTGTPKIVPRTHNGLVCAVEYCSKSWGQHGEDINLVVGSIGHDLSFTKGFLGSVITLGTLVMLDTADTQAVCETIEREKVTAVVWVPTLAQRLLQYEDLDKYDLSSLKKMHSAGGAAMPGLVRDVFGRLRVRFCNGYGATEGMTTITRAVDDVETVCSTVGRPTCPGDIYKVVDPRGHTLPPDTPGELLVKGPSVFSGYYRNPEENAKVFDEDGFFVTGDVATIDPRAYVTITGRIKEMINRGGESISATVVEGLIDRHPDVDLVAVVAMPDPLMGERVCAYVQPRTGVRLCFDDIITFLRSQGASVLQLPERIEFVDSMPYTAAQKLDKKALRADIAKKLEAEAAGGGAAPAA